MLDGVMLLWFALTALSVAFVALDIRTTPESAVLKWGFVLLTAYTGPFGVMSLALLAGFLAAYPMNWWLVARHLITG